ncbi:MAG: O-antigen ligase family protein [Ardenticatenaceae bacterium]|nr:O-antigen ligase family protein [Ardenticatenaceae bacterium]
MPTPTSVILSRLSLLVLSIFAFTLPFERDSPLFALGPLTVTNVEVTLSLCLVAAVWLTWRNPLHGKRPFPRWWFLLMGLFIASLLLSSWLTAEFPATALKASLRTISGILLALALPTLIRSRQQFVVVALALLAGGLLAALLGLIELVRGEAWAILDSLRLTPTAAGPFLRLTGPFDYANHTAMYFEATLPLLLVATIAAYENGRRALLMPTLILLFVYLESTFLTFSRASFATILLVSLCLAFLLWFAPQPASKQPSLFWASLAGLTLILIPVNLLLNNTFRLRLSSEGDNEWYEAHIDAPASLQVDADEIVPITITVHNNGRLHWANSGENLVTIAAIWAQADTQLEWQNTMRWSLGQPVAPGESLTIELPVPTPPAAGNYHLTWNLIQEGIVWFEGKNGLITSTQVQVGSTAATAPTTTMNLVQTTPVPAPIPGRLTLWQTAWQIFRRQPIWGIGLDNFRLVYGRELGHTLWNDSIHTNSWYVETAVSTGIIGTLPFFTWLGLIVADIWRTLRQPTAWAWQTAVAAGILAYLIHGLLDYFLLFNSTGLLFWLLIGFWFSLKQLQTEQSPTPYAK